MAAILPAGYRAISTEISPETGAGGFILPNDRVDVLLTKREKNPDKAGPDISSAEVILSNVRVLAIDQAPKEKEGTNSLVGKTVTLELKPEQAETLARSRQSGSLTLALRSIADVNTVEKPDDQLNKRGENINVVVIDTGIDPEHPDLVHAYAGGYNALDPQAPAGGQSDSTGAAGDHRDSAGQSSRQIHQASPIA